MTSREQALDNALSAWIRRKKILKRWPCFYCGRRNQDAPLRTVTITNEDGQEFIAGCDSCNDDGLIAQSEAALAIVADLERYDTTAVRHAREEARNCKRMLWAAVDSAPNPLRVSRISLQDYGPDSVLEVTDDPETGTTLLRARSAKVSKESA